MKKILLTLLVLLVLSSFIYSQDQQQSFTVGYWVNVDDDYYAVRATNALSEALESSSEWNFEAKLQEWNADIHVMLSGKRVLDTGYYVWAVAYTPIFAPRFMNSNVGYAEDTISNVNMMARDAATFVEEQLYILYDSIASERNNS